MDPVTTVPALPVTILLAETSAPGIIARDGSEGSCRAVSFVEEPDLGQSIPL